jgi:hypothetical protein
MHSRKLFRKANAKEPFDENEDEPYDEKLMGNSNLLSLGEIRSLFCCFVFILFSLWLFDVFILLLCLVFLTFRLFGETAQSKELNKRRCFCKYGVTSLHDASL